VSSSADSNNWEEALAFEEAPSAAGSSYRSGKADQLTTPGSFFS
jgi:hypothetical protein